MNFDWSFCGQLIKVCESLNSFRGFNNSDMHFSHKSNNSSLLLLSSKIILFSGKNLGFQDCPSTDPSASRAKHKHFSLLLFSSYLAVTLFTVLLVLVPFLNYEAARSFFPSHRSSHFQTPNKHLYCFSPPGCSTSTLIHHPTDDSWALCLCFACSARTFCSLQPTAQPEGSCLMHL